MCTHFRTVPFTGLYKHSQKLRETIEPLAIYPEVIKKIQTCKLFGRKTTENNLLDYYTWVLGSIVSTLCCINVKGHPRRKAAGVLSLSVPVCGESCWHS